MSIDYKKELETAAKSMILVREPDSLIKMIIRVLIQRVKVIHAGILLQDETRNTYVLRVSRGPTGIKIPREFARMDYNNPLINFFQQHRAKEIFGDNVIIYQETKHFLRKRIHKEIKQTLNDVLYQMKILEADACIPSYFHKDLLGILFLGKKKNNRDFHRKELNFIIALASDVAMAIRNAKLFKQLQEELDKRHQLFINTTVALAAAIEAKDHYTHGHTQRVTNLSLEIGRKIIKKDIHLEHRFLEHLQIAALLHDIGKIGVPEIILNKQGKLNDEERQKMQLHPVIGANILEPIKELKTAIEGVKYHHERYDGKGYPEGLSSDGIPIIAAIIAVADAFDAMVSNRPYRKAMSKEKAILEIKHASGQQFHPLVTSTLFQLYEQGKI